MRSDNGFFEYRAALVAEISRDPVLRAIVENLGAAAIGEDPDWKSEPMLKILKQAGGDQAVERYLAFLADEHKLLEIAAATGMLSPSGRS